MVRFGPKMTHFFFGGLGEALQNGHFWAKMAENRSFWRGMGLVNFGHFLVILARPGFGQDLMVILVNLVKFDQNGQNWSF